VPDTRTLSPSLTARLNPIVDSKGDPDDTRRRVTPGWSGRSLPSYGSPVRWTVHGERPIYESEWVSLTLVDLEVPGHGRFDHHVVRVPNEAAGAVVHEPDRGLLLLWRHRFITDTWGWEIPAGKIDPGETPVEAAAREVVEETGWRVERLDPLISYQPTNGMSDQKFHLFLSTGATYAGPPSDPSESERIEWVPLDQLRALVAGGQMMDGLSLTAVLYALAFGRIG
jgi:8-oxo-dGTP pyrophosphatase MutT (NUDIX family)